MPAWWKGKSKSHSSSSAVSSPGSSSRKKDAAAAAAAPFIASYGPKPSKKEKAKSFDEAVHGRKCDKPRGDRSGFAFDYDGERPCHPLPPPLASFFPGSSVDHGLGAGSASGAGGLGSASASVSSVGSSGTDEGADFQRNLEPVNTPRGRNTNTLPDYWKQHVAEERLLHSRSPERPSDISLSPRREFQLSGPDFFSEGRSPSYAMTPAEASSRGRMRSPGPESRGLYLSTSAMQPRTLVMNAELSSGRQDDVKSPHPLPLPPNSPTSSSSPTVHSLQSKWKKGKLLGRGTFGHVFLAFNSESGQMGAIKEVKVISDDSNSRESLKQLSQEISLLSQLSHPNIVQYYGSELVDDTLCVYLEYVSGGSIHKLLQEYGPFGEPVIRSYTAQLLSGLAYLHGRNTVHRDIKGANILVDPNGEVKLADFGMAKHISSQNSIRSFKGSPYWMAPEVIMNAGGYNLSVDVWSLGCTILEMATTKPPWCQYEGVAAIFKIGNSKDIPEIPSYLSNDAKNFLKLCLQRDPSARPTAAQLMEHPFVRDQASAKFARLNISRDLFPSSLDGTLSPPSEYYGGASHLHDRDYPMRHTIASYPTLRSPSDLANARTNLSLPVSPSSSPLRSFRQSTWSCLPSPPHPAHARGAPNGVQNGFLLNPVGARQTYLDPFLDISQPRPQPLYSPTRT